MAQQAGILFAKNLKYERHPLKNSRAKRKRYIAIVIIVESADSDDKVAELAAKNAALLLLFSRE